MTPRVWTRVSGAIVAVGAILWLVGCAAQDRGSALIDPVYRHPAAADPRDGDPPPARLFFDPIGPSPRPDAIAGVEINNTPRAQAP